MGLFLANLLNKGKGYFFIVENYFDIFAKKDFFGGAAATGAGSRG